MKKRSILFLLLLTDLVLIVFIAVSSAGTEKAIASDQNTFFTEAQTIATGLEALSQENLPLLEQLRESLFSLPYQDISIREDGKTFLGDGEKRTPEEIARYAPDLLPTLQALQEAGFPDLAHADLSVRSVTFSSISEVRGGAGYSICLTSPPEEGTSYLPRIGYLTVSENWGIHWQGNSMSCQAVERERGTATALSILTIIGCGIFLLLLRSR